MDNTHPEFNQLRSLPDELQQLRYLHHEGGLTAQNHRHRRNAVQLAIFIQIGGKGCVRLKAL
jgi:hypothetical protein